MRLSPVVFLAAVIGTALVIGARVGGHPEPSHESRPARPTSLIAPAHPATPIVRPAHFLDGDSRWVDARGTITIESTPALRQASKPVFSSRRGSGAFEGSPGLPENDDSPIIQ